MNLRGKPGDPAKKSAKPSVNLRLQMARQRIDDLRELVSQISVPPHHQRTMSYAEAIRWLVTNRPPDGSASQAAVLRLPRRDGAIDITFVFLNAVGEVVPDRDGKPYGHTFIVDTIDEELADAFGETPLLLVN